MKLEKLVRKIEEFRDTSSMKYRPFEFKTKLNNFIVDELEKITDKHKQEKYLRKASELYDAVDDVLEKLDLEEFKLDMFFFKGRFIHKPYLDQALSCLNLTFRENLTLDNLDKPVSLLIKFNSEIKVDFYDKDFFLKVLLDLADKYNGAITNFSIFEIEMEKRTESNGDNDKIFRSSTESLHVYGEQKDRYFIKFTFKGRCLEEILDNKKEVLTYELKKFKYLDKSGDKINKSIKVGL